MKKLLLGLLAFSIPVITWAGRIPITPGVGQNVHTDTVGGEEYQAVKIFDATTGGTSSMTVTAAGAAKVDGSAVTQPVSQVGAWIASPGTGTYPVAGAVTQSGAWVASPGTGTYPVGGSVQVASATVNLPTTYTSGLNYLSQTTTGTLRVDLSTLGGTTLTQTGGAQDINIKTGSIGNTSFGATQAVDSALNGSFSLKGTSNTVTVGNTITVAGLYSGTTTQIVNSTITVYGFLGDNGIAATTNRQGIVAGIYQTDYMNGTAGTQGRDAALNVGTDGNVATAHNPAMRPVWFMASTNTFTLAASPTDVSALCGNASNTVIVTGLRVSCTQTTAGIIGLTVDKRSTKFTGAYSTMTAVGANSNYAVTNSSAVFFTVNPTVGTLLAQIDNQKLGCMAPGTASPNDIYISPSNWRDRALALNGTAECITVNLGGITVTGGALAVSWDWIETKTITP